MLKTYNRLKQLANDSDQLYQLTDADIKDIQIRLLDVLKDFCSVCEKYHLTYCISGGTGLGAIRHGGYIPWDEDLDLCMPRKDYDRFEALFLQEFSEKYDVQNLHTSPAYDLSFMKIRVKNTRYRELFDSEPEKAGLFLDIFPVENIYDNPVARKCHGLVTEALLLICSCVRMKQKKEILMKYTEGSQGLNSAVRMKIVLGRLFSFRSLHKWLVTQDRFASRCHNEESREVSIPSGRGHYFGEIFSREAFYPTKKIAFENLECDIMNDPHHYLSKLYGDYMIIPKDADKEKHCVIEYNLDGAVDHP